MRGAAGLGGRRSGAGEGGDGERWMRRSRVGGRGDEGEGMVCTVGGLTRPKSVFWAKIRSPARPKIKNVSRQEEN
jgi:hypothetical protein